MEQKKKRSALFLVGAGASVSAGIPVAEGIIENIKNQFPYLCNNKTCSNYSDYMELISLAQRRELIKGLVDKAKLNISYLYLSALIKAGYADRVLTTNFDDLIERALALENIFPAIYDFASSQEFIKGEAADISLFHLHGQKDGFILSNTKEEVENTKEKMKDVFDDSIQKRTIIVVGYSGINDPVFKLLAEMPDYENRLYWVGYKNEKPEKQVENEILERYKKYAFYIKGCNSDEFIRKLCNELKIGGPRIVEKPFSYLQEVLNCIAKFKIDDKKTDPVTETKKYVNRAINIFEKDIERFENFKSEFEEIKNDKITKFARDAWINADYNKYDELRKLVNKDSSVETIDYFVRFIYNMGLVSHRDAIKEQNKQEKEELLNKAICKYKEAIEINEKHYYSYYNCGLALLVLAEIKTDVDVEKEKLLQEAIEKFQKTIDLNFDDSRVYYILARCYSINKEVEKALDSFDKSLRRKNGLTIKYINEDKDFDNIRNTARFKELLDKYFPE
jgi:NAD-dependent SIR2 family protein deacetylase